MTSLRNSLRSRLHGTCKGRCLVAAAALASLLLAGCAHFEAQGSLDATPPEYRIGKEDVLEVTVWKDPALSRTVPVRNDGKITLPLIGDLVAAGRTPDELSTEIRKRLVPLVKEPSVHVIVRESNSARFYIVGEVARPGVYRIHGSVTPLEAIAMAGGLTEFASRSRIRVIRRVAGRQQSVRVDFDDLVRGKARLQALAPGDTVYVP